MVSHLITPPIRDAVVAAASPYSKTASVSLRGLKMAARETLKPLLLTKDRR